jgi:hypothetical protein
MTAAELFPGRLSIHIPEFCGALGWSRARYYRHKSKINTVEGFGVPMIPVSELARIMGESEPAQQCITNGEEAR